MDTLKTIKPTVRKLGMYSIRVNDKEINKEPPALITVGAVKAITRARGDEQAIPRVEIYTDDQGLAGQEATPERFVSRAMREAKGRVKTRKEMIEAEKELLTAKIEEEIAKEVVENVVEKGVVKKVIKKKPEESAIVKYEDIEATKQQKKVAKAQAKTEQARAEQLKAYADIAKARAEYEKSNLFKYMSKRSSELKKEEGLSLSDAREVARIEWKGVSESEKTKAGAGGSSSDKTILLTESEGKKKLKPLPKDAIVEVEEGKEEGKPRSKIVIKTKDKSEPEKERIEKVLKEEIKEKKKSTRVGGLTQKQIVSGIKALNDSDLEKEYKREFPYRRKAVSRTVMQNALIKSMGGRVTGGKYEFLTESD